MKEDFLSKFKDYNKVLEKILEKKDFSQEVKNLLLSMFYKLELAYNDYSFVKRKSKTKQEYLENILNNIKDTNKIELIQAKDINFKNIKQNGFYEINFKLKRIKVVGNEFAILFALLELSDFQMNLREEYHLIKKSMEYLLNTSYEIENVEVLRDFNAWSWNIVVEEIKDIAINLIYQNLRIALNIDIFTKVEDIGIDVIKYIEQKLLKIYNKEVVAEFLSLIFKISIIIYIKINNEERKRLFEEKNRIESYLNQISDKKTYINNISEEKRRLTSELKKIELTINNRELLLKEFERRNQILPEYNRIVNLSHLVEKLQMEKAKILHKIEMYNKKVLPETYFENRSNFQKKYNILKDIDFDKDNDIYKYIEELQEIFVKNIFIKKIEKISNKSELIDCVYELRYYKFLPYNKEKTIKDIENINNDLKEAEEILIKKLYNNKIINTISTNEKNDIEIVRSIFNLKIINMESIYIQVEKYDNNYRISIYDDKETKETELEMDLKFNPKDKIKLNRKIKLFKTER